MTAEEALVEFVQQYRGVDAAEARRLIEAESWTWSGTPTALTQEDVARTYRVVSVRDRALRLLDDSDRERVRDDFLRISRGGQREINDETYRRFRERSRFSSPLDANSDPRLRSYWHRIREEILREREAVRNLSEPIRDFIFGNSVGGRPITPADYPALLRIAEKLSQMSAADRDRYLASTTARTTNLALFENALDMFIGRLETQRQATVERDQAKAALLGLEQVYDRYRVWKAWREGAERATGLQSIFSGMGSEGAGMGPDLQGHAIGTQIVAAQQTEELTELLRQHGYPAIRAFEEAIERFEAAFRAEALLIANDMLARYEHVLWTQEERYRDSATMSRLHGQLAPARQHYEEADRITREHGIIPGPFSPMDDYAQMQHFAGLRQQELQAGFGAVQGLAGENPLFGDIDFPAQEIATAPAGRLQGDLRRYIVEHPRHLQETPTNLTNSPTSSGSSTSSSSAHAWRRKSGRSRSTTASSTTAPTTAAWPRR